MQTEAFPRATSVQHTTHNCLLFGFLGDGGWLGGGGLDQEQATRLFLNPLQGTGIANRTHLDTAHRHRKHSS